MSRYKNVILFFVMVVLAVFTFWILVGDNTSSESIRKVDFSIKTAANPDSVILSNNHRSNFLSLRNGSYLFNNNYRVKPELEEAFFLILKQMEVKRPVSVKMQDKLSASIDTAGMLVEIYERKNLLRSFEIWGDKEQQKSYVRLPDEAAIYLVNIPGYSTYIADIFFYDESKWRNAALFESTWRSLKELKIQFTGSDSSDVSIEYSGEYFKIKELEAFDTLAILEYLEQFSQINVSNYLPYASDIVDSLLSKQPDLVISIKDLDISKSNKYLFYENSPEHKLGVLVVGKDKQVGLISKHQFSEIAKKGSYFSVKNESD